MCIFSCDLGGTFTKWGIFENGQLIGNGEFESGANYGGDVLLNRLIEKIPLILNGRKLEGIAISSAGTINHLTGLVEQASDIIPGYRGMNIIKEIGKVFNVPVVVDNDVNCAMYAEAINGAGKEASIVYGMTLGTGVGSAIIINKKVYHGANYFAGEIGYLIVNNEVLDLSGSTRGLSYRVANRKLENKELWNGKRVFEGYKNNDSICVEEVERLAENVAQVIAQSICFLNPEVIVLGGGVMAQKEIILPLVKEHLSCKIPSHILSKTSIKAAVYGNLAGIYGAYYLFIESMSKTV